MVIVHIPKGSFSTQSKHPSTIKIANAERQYVMLKKQAELHVLFFFAHSRAASFTLQTVTENQNGFYSVADRASYLMQLKQRSLSQTLHKLHSTVLLISDIKHAFYFLTIHKELSYMNHIRSTMHIKMVQLSMSGHDTVYSFT